MAVLTWSGVASVDKSFYDVARTLGANRRFLILKVAIPAALPHVFVGLFMGLSASFAVLVVAEMLGVKSGLGWYLAMGAGVGGLSQHVCGPHRNGADLLQPDHGAVKDPQSAPGLAAGPRPMVAAALARAQPAEGVSLEIDDVSHAFDLGGGRLDLLDHIDLCAAPGEFAAALGRSGCVKSTLLRLLAGLEAPSCSADDVVATVQQLGGEGSDDPRLAEPKKSGV